MSSTDALEYTGEREEEKEEEEEEEEQQEHIRGQKDSLLNHEQRDHFYYLDGVMRRKEKKASFILSESNRGGADPGLPPGPRGARSSGRSADGRTQEGQSSFFFLSAPIRF
ncbi:hypothetical protein EYF80_050715 [Liparis tanakae]|uniref:Uncharacterized protein n=1 Tax=Liparis tanakae TaxID=230148 RepID=A0A4Z2FDZ2_9TELE|nr:hypothetical protein EYF80_050715 [Liparis tanakae]